MQSKISGGLPVTVLLAARNEAVNLPRCLAALKPAARVIVLDSHSTDATAEIARAWGAEVVQFDYGCGSFETTLCIQESSG
jgi:glycosyltransferase involved in cell wall biosynthesis